MPFLRTGLITAALLTSALRAAAVCAQDATVTRADLATRYLLMDRAYASADSMGRLTDSVRAAANRLFDRSTLSFFGGRFAVTAAIMDSAITLVDPTYRFVRPTFPATPVEGKPARVVREALLARLANLDTLGPLAQPIASAKARARLLVDTISPERSAEFLADRPALARAVSAEVAQLERGRDPYAEQVGDLWRVVRGAGGADIPVRVIVPPRARGAATAPRGVLIALHGAGGDENMFVSGYGQGVAARLARDAGLLLVSPFTNAMTSDPAAQFDSLMTVLRREHRIDTTRVYVMGHSMGAGVAAQLAARRPRAITAVACLAGGAPVTVADAPPMLFLGAALDPIIPAARVRTAAAGTRTGRYEERANEGHTLMVRGAALRAVPWLMEQTR